MLVCESVVIRQSVQREKPFSSELLKEYMYNLNDAELQTY